MSSQLYCKVLVFILLHLFVNANPQYTYLYPYAQQYNYNYPQIPTYGGYGQSYYPNPMYSNYPVVPQYEQVPQHGQVIHYRQVPQYGLIPQYGQVPQYGQIPQTIPQQGGLYPVPFPYMQQTYVPTIYGNIPVEIVDVDPETFYLKGTENTTTNETNSETSSSETSFTQEQKEPEIIRKPVSTSSVVESKPQSTAITRLIDPKSSKISVTVQTPKPQLKKEDNSIEKDEENEIDNETTTKKYFNFFRR